MFLGKNFIRSSGWLLGSDAVLLLSPSMALLSAPGVVPTPVHQIANEMRRRSGVVAITITTQICTFNVHIPLHCCFFFAFFFKSITMQWTGDGNGEKTRLAICVAVCARAQHEEAASARRKYEHIQLLQIKQNKQVHQFQCWSICNFISSSPFHLILCWFVCLLLFIFILLLVISCTSYDPIEMKIDFTAFLFIIIISNGRSHRSSEKQLFCLRHLATLLRALFSV